MPAAPNHPASPLSRAPGRQQLPADAQDLLLSITRQTAESHEESALLQSVVEASLSVVRAAEKCVLHLLADDLLIPSYCSQPWPAEQRHAGIPAGVGIAGQVLLANRTICVADTAQDDVYAPLRSGDDIRSLMVVPLSFGAIRLGTLSLSSAVPHAFDACATDYVEILAAQAAIAIHQTRLVAQARAEQTRSDIIVERMSDGLLILGPDGSLVRANGAVAELLGMDRGLGDDSAPAALADAIDQVVDRRAVILGDYCAQARNRDGLRIDLEVRPSAPLEASDRILVLRNMSQDREAAEHRSFFISQISHELRTPLQHILSSVSLIGDIPDLGPDDRQRYLRHIEDETYHLGKLVDDLVALSRIEAGHFEVYPEPVKVDELLGSVADRLEPRAETRHLTIVMHCTERPVWAYTDPLRLEQVLLNVLSNACKYTPARSCIRVTVLADEDQVEVLVADQGPGIPPEEMQLIFDPYYRLSRNVHEPGMGLGLFISQQIMTMLGGQISVRSPSGAGSVFAIRFPRGLHLLRNR